MLCDITFSRQFIDRHRNSLSIELSLQLQHGDLSEAHVPFDQACPSVLLSRRSCRGPLGNSLNKKPFKFFSSLVAHQTRLLVEHQLVGGPEDHIPNLEHLSQKFLVFSRGNCARGLVPRCLIDHQEYPLPLVLEKVYLHSEVEG